MALHLIKLCVGADSVEDLRGWIDFRLGQQRGAGREPRQVHTTRMTPKRAGEIVGTGSLYWVIKGRVQCRQRILDLEPFTDGEGISRCNIVLEPKLVLTRSQPKRPFQGWRYFKEEDVPADLKSGEEGLAVLPAGMRNELADLGLI
ncbi:DUF1489 family protein [Oricola cellulosilytica]|uniref:DUF1489 family protein n=1 Tax=Oricola cellulosilytica TaxID=1429082 RepID=A0A4R0PB72_9HYPH|nr:DUF1489 family protein [Oricola cellulosilytica]TCD13228.1 DUF1489 family protein [Oricola cellulosilytica]